MTVFDAIETHVIMELVINHAKPQRVALMTRYSNLRSCLDTFHCDLRACGGEQ